MDVASRRQAGSDVDKLPYSCFGGKKLDCTPKELSIIPRRYRRVWHDGQEFLRSAPVRVVILLSAKQVIVHSGNVRLSRIGGGCRSTFAHEPITQLSVSAPANAAPMRTFAQRCSRRCAYHAPCVRGKRLAFTWAVLRADFRVLPRDHASRRRRSARVPASGRADT